MVDISIHVRLFVGYKALLQLSPSMDFSLCAEHHALIHGGKLTNHDYDVSLLTWYVVDFHDI